MRTLHLDPACFDAFILHLCAPDSVFFIISEQIGFNGFRPCHRDQVLLCLHIVEWTGLSACDHIRQQVHQLLQFRSTAKPACHPKADIRFQSQFPPVLLQFLFERFHLVVAAFLDGHPVSSFLQYHPYPDTLSASP